MSDLIPTTEENTFISSNLDCDISALALKLGRHSLFNVQRVLRQIAGYQVIKKKVPAWYANPDLVFPASLSLEQCSSEITANYKSGIVKRILDNSSVKNQMADLTGGLGVDFTFMANCFDKATYVERQSELCDIAQHNFEVLGLSNAEVFNSDGIEFLKTSQQKYDLIYLDPARRDSKGVKAVMLYDCEPDMTLIKNQLLEKASIVMVKLSPMLDISMALKQLHETVEVHVVSVDNECKELLFVLKPGDDEIQTTLHCVNLLSNSEIREFVFTKKDEQEAVCIYADKPGKYLYEPNASLLKAGAFCMISKTFNLKKLHPNSHLYTSDNYLSDFPGRGFEVDKYFSYQPKIMKSHLGGVDKANITVRNFNDTVADIRKKSKIGEGGDLYLFATTLYDGKKVIISCKKNN